MFFYLSKALNFLIDPITLVIISFLSSYFLLPSKYKKRGYFTGVLLFLFFTNTIISNELLKNLEQQKNTFANKKHYTYGILLCGTTKQDHYPLNNIHFVNADRIIYTFNLYKNDQIDTLVISGGKGTLDQKGIAESILLKELYISMGIPAIKIKIDSLSNNTFENAIEVKKMNLRVSPMVLITSAFHMQRAALCFHKQGIITDYYPVDYKAKYGAYQTTDYFVPNYKSIESFHYIIHEYIGIAVYYFKGYI